MIEFFNNQNLPGKMAIVLLIAILGAVLVMAVIDILKGENENYEQRNILE